MRPLTARDVAKMPARQVEIGIGIDHLSGGIVSAQCFCHRYVDLLHLIEMPDGWKIVNAVWRPR